MRRLLSFTILLILSATYAQESVYQNRHPITDVKAKGDGMEVVNPHGTNAFMNSNLQVRLEILNECRVIQQPQGIEATTYDKIPQVEFIKNVMGDCSGSYPFKVERKGIDRSTIVLPSLIKNSAALYRAVAVEF